MCLASLKFAKHCKKVTLWGTHVFCPWPWQSFSTGTQSAFSVHLSSSLSTDSCLSPPIVSPLVSPSISLSAATVHQYNTVSQRSDNWQLSIQRPGTAVYIQGFNSWNAISCQYTHTHIHIAPDMHCTALTHTLFSLHPHHTCSSLMHGNLVW